MEEYTEYILNHIRENLTGEYEKDMQYLHDCSEKYKDDEDSTDILREIASMMYEILPDSEKSQVQSKLKELNGNMETAYEAVLDMVKNGDYDNARTAMEEILASADGRFAENDEDIYLSLNHIMELYEYSYYFDPKKNIKCTDIMYNEYYRTYGVILAGLGEKERAEEAFLTAVKWNPVDLDSILMLAENYLDMPGGLEKYRDKTVQAHRYCCTRATMARYYRNMGRYYLEKYEPETARALYVYSKIYFDSEAADSALDFIKKALGKDNPDYSIKELQKILEDNDIELGPDSDTIGIIYRVGNLMMEDKDYERAKDCFAIVYDITQDEATGDILAQIINYKN